MAKMFPERINDGAPPSEHAVFEALSDIDDSWMVFHSVRWQGQRATE